MFDLAAIDAKNLPDEGDPLIWLRKHKEEISEKYPTVEALSTYLKQFNSVANALVCVRAKIAEQRNSDSEA